MTSDGWCAAHHCFRTECTYRTHVHTVRCLNSLWEKVAARAAAEGKDTNSWVTAALEARAETGGLKRWRDTKHAAALAWADALDNDDFAEFCAELTQAASANDPAAIETCLRGWRVTAEALSDPQVRAALTGPVAEGDFGEVPRP